MRINEKILCTNSIASNAQPNCCKLNGVMPCAESASKLAMYGNANDDRVDSPKNSSPMPNLPLYRSTYLKICQNLLSCFAFTLLPVLAWVVAGSVSVSAGVWVVIVWWCVMRCRGKKNLVSNNLTLHWVYNASAISGFYENS